MRVPLEKGPATIVLYPIVQTEIDEEQIWRAEENAATDETRLGLYLHIPFCRSLCSFCPFVKSLWKAEKEKTYVDALIEEMRLYAKLPFTKRKQVTTVYFGGGTPTSLSTESLVRLIDAVKMKFSVAPGAEIAMESHALTSLEDKLERLKEKGVSRMTMGVQTFTDRLQRILGCAHTEADAAAAIATVKKIGFESVGVDLFFRIPTQSMEDWKRDLETAAAHGVDHISCYNLGVYNGTGLYQKIKNGEIPEQPTQDEGADMHAFARSYLKEQGYEEYSISNFAKEGKSCRYLKLTLEAPQGEHLGLGVSSFEYANGFYSCKVSSLERYVEQVGGGRIPYAKGTHISRKEAMARYMVLGTGCIRVSKDKFKSLFGVAMNNVYADIISDLKRWDLVEENASDLWLTETGVGYAASIAKLFYTAESDGIVQGVKVV